MAMVGQDIGVSLRDEQPAGDAQLGVPRPAPTRIKNLDTGEEYDLESFGVDDNPVGGHGSDTSGDPRGALDEELQRKDTNGKRKGWLKGTKKLKSWAKNVATNVRERIHERIDKPQHAAWQPPPWPEESSYDVAEASRSQSSAAGSVAPRQFSDAVWGLPPPHAAAADRPGPMGQGSLVGQGHGNVPLGPLAAALKERGGVGAVLALPVSYDASTSVPSALPSGSAAAAGPQRLAGGHGRTSTRQPAYPAAGHIGRGVVSAGAGPLAPPPLPPEAEPRQLSVSQGEPSVSSRCESSPGRPSAASVPAGAPASGATEDFALESLEMARNGSDDGGSESAAETGEQDVPLLREEAVGPSSRAVPASKSWLNQPARVGGRRGALRQLQQVRMVQELPEHEGPVWALRFSADARLLASGGRDGVLRVWAVYWYPSGRSKLISPASDYQDSQLGPASTAALSITSGPSASAYGAASSCGPAGGAAGPAASRPALLSENPLLALPGHRGDVLDLSWSQCRLLLTASADQTARLWHIDVGLGDAAAGGGGEAGECGGGGDGGGCPSGECLRSFVHPDLVTSCCFHPTDPRRIVTGCADGKIRVWSVPDGSVLAAATVPQDVITRVLFSADASRVLAGTLRGKARHYEYSPAAGSLEYLSQVDVKNTHGSGRKVTGLVQVPYTYGNDQLYLITSADSRIRLYVGYVQERKFKGHRHANTQIAASLSPSCQHIACGSDDGWVYVWETGLPPPSAAAAAATGSAAPGAGSIAAGSSSKSGLAAGGGGGKGAASAASSFRSIGGGGKVKEGTYEAFQTPEQTTTVAIFAPDVCRLGRGLERAAAGAEGGGTQASNAAGAAGPAGAAAAGASPLLGSLFVVAGFSGSIYVYENLPAQ